MLNQTARKLIAAVAACVFLFSGGRVAQHRWQEYTSARRADQLVQLAVTPAPVAPAPEPQAPSADPVTEVIDPTLPEPAQPVPEAPAVPRETAPIQVDFDLLRAQNPDIAAWIYSPDTPINYPILQAADNSYYLTRLVDGSYNKYGSLFLDYRNPADLSDWNSVVYGHNMKNESMFGSLLGYQDQGYFEAHPKLYLLTPGASYVIRVAAGCLIPSDSPLYNSLNPEEAQRARLIADWLAASDFTSGLTPTHQDRLITLSTCSYEYDTARYVVLGVLEQLEG